MMAGHTPAGIKGSGAPLKGTKLAEAEPLAADPPVPPPVKLAPFACDSKWLISAEEEMEKEKMAYSNRPRVIRELASTWCAETLSGNGIPERCGAIGGHWIT
jgi:hypothetical protein